MHEVEERKKHEKSTPKIPRVKPESKRRKNAITPINHKPKKTLGIRNSVHGKKQGKLPSSTVGRMKSSFFSVTCCFLDLDGISKSRNVFHAASARHSRNDWFHRASVLPIENQEVFERDCRNDCKSRLSKLQSKEAVPW